MSQVDVTFGILNYNPHNHIEAELALRECIESFEANASKDITKEIYLIDQGSDLAQQQKLLSSYANQYSWRTLFLERNVGISRGINMLAKIARGQNVCLITSDTVFSQGLDISLLQELNSRSDLWQVCPASDNTSINYQKIGYLTSGLFPCIAQELTIQMWPRFVFDKIGYFDERWKACYENLDFALRIVLAGGTVGVSHDSFCAHKHEMTRKNKSRDETYKDYINMPDGFDQGKLHEMWNVKWRGLDWNLMYQNVTSKSFIILSEEFKHNIYLPYVQNVIY